jgi:hypothetical protein
MITWLMLAQVIVLYKMIKSCSIEFPKMYQTNASVALAASGIVMVAMTVPAIYTLFDLFLPAWGIGPNLFCGRL